jgi:hypothetical protein
LVQLSDRVLANLKRHDRGCDESLRIALRHTYSDGTDINAQSSTYTHTG